MKDSHKNVSVQLKGSWMASKRLLSTCLTFMKTLDPLGLRIHIYKMTIWYRNERKGSKALSASVAALGSGPAHASS